MAGLGSLFALIVLFSTQTLAQTQAAVGGAAQQVDLLLSLPGACSNWDAVVAGVSGEPWVAGGQPCGGRISWKGLGCEYGAVTEISLPSLGLQCSSLPAELAQLQKLKLLDLSSNLISGTVPDEWTAVGAFPALETLQLAGNSLTGALDDFTPEGGGMIASLYFNVSRNGFSQGPIPGGWYSKTLALIDISYNNVSGPMPLEWGLPVAGHPDYTSALPKLARLGIEGNNLSGPADPWPRGAANVFAPGFYCTAEPGNPLLEMAEAPASSDADLLLSLPKACNNWESATVGVSGKPWSASTMPCGDGSENSAWVGIKCNQGGAVTDVSLPSLGLQCSSLPAELAQLESLKLLDLSSNLISGTVPDEWTAVGAFPALETLQLANNVLTGALDDFTPTATGMIASLSFNVSRNGFSQGPIPGRWYSKTLALIDISYNNVSGPMPLEWGLPVAGHPDYTSALPKLARLGIEGNNLSGPADPWPRGAANVFAPGFYCTAEPGNPLLEMAEAPASGRNGGGGGSDSSGGGLSGGAIAGIVVGAVAAAAVLAVVAGLLVTRRRRRLAAAATSAPAGAAGSGRKDGYGTDWGDAAEKGDMMDSALAFKKRTPGGGDQGRDGGGGVANLSHSSVVTMTDSAVMPSSAASSVLAPGSGAGSGPVILEENPTQPDTDARRVPAEWNIVRFSELELAHSLGAGSYGAVVLAKWCQTTVAVKMLSPDKVAGASDSMHHKAIMRQLEREAGIMSRLRHTNICLYMGACEDPACLIMEYCARKSVDTLLAAGLRDPKASKHLTWPRLLSMACDAAKGMLYLHTRQPAVYHRDLKSANLLVTSQWQVKVADFNLSRVLEQDYMSSVCVQNPRWLAPEILAGGNGSLAADVWAFGTVMWELMTWQIPYPGCNPYQIINTVQATVKGSGLAIPPPDQLPAGPFGQYGPYVALMEACWERDPTKRPSFEEVASRLRAMLSAEMRRPSAPSPMGSAAIGSTEVSVIASPQQLSAASPRQPGDRPAAGSGMTSGQPMTPTSGSQPASAVTSVAPSAATSAAGASGAGASAASTGAAAGASGSSTPVMPRSPFEAPPGAASQPFRATQSPPGGLQQPPLSPFAAIAADTKQSSSDSIPPSPFMGASSSNTPPSQQRSAEKVVPPPPPSPFAA